MNSVQSTPDNFCKKRISKVKPCVLELDGVQNSPARIDEVKPKSGCRRQPLFNTIQAAPRFELGVKDLQSSALPLGHATRKTRLLIFYHKILQESNFPECEA